jgi:hypothetical protein
VGARWPQLVHGHRLLDRCAHEVVPAALDVHPAAVRVHSPPGRVQWQRARADSAATAARHVLASSRALNRQYCARHHAAEAER